MADDGQKREIDEITLFILEVIQLIAKHLYASNQLWFRVKSFVEYSRMISRPGYNCSVQFGCEVECWQALDKKREPLSGQVNGEITLIKKKEQKWRKGNVEGSISVSGWGYYFRSNRSRNDSLLAITVAVKSSAGGVDHKMVILLQDEHQPIPIKISDLEPGFEVKIQDKSGNHYHQAVFYKRERNIFHFRLDQTMIQMKFDDIYAIWLLKNPSQEV